MQGNDKTLSKFLWHAIWSMFPKAHLVDKLFHRENDHFPTIHKMQHCAGYHHVLAVSRLRMRVHSVCPVHAPRRLDASMNGTIKIYVKQTYPFSSADVHGLRCEIAFI